MMDSSKPSTALFDVFLRLRPSSAIDRERFLDVEHIQGQEPTHITIKPPANDTRKKAVEKFAFTRVFEEHAGQRQLFEDSGAVKLVEGVLGAKGREGKDGLLATLGVTGSGKSHTILGSKSQRGITQLTLDLLFQQTAEHLVDIDTSPSAFQSLCTADVAESQLFPAANFLDSIYSDNNNYGPSRGTTPARGMTPARGATPALVRDYSLLPPEHMPGAFPSPSALTSPPPQQTSRHSTVFDRLYPSLAKYDKRTSHFPKSPPKSPSKLGYITRSIAKLTSSPQHETSFLSAPSSRRNAPRVSTMPNYPPIDDMAIDVDTNAEYAIVISMYEVHNDRIFDLLSGAPPQKRRALLFKSTGMSPDRKVVAGLKKVVCSDLEEALLVLETGLHERRVATTTSNATSSRSHGFFCIEVKKRARPTNKAIPISSPWTSSTLTVVDLAGSERARIAKTAGATLAEAGKINESLMYLGQCMQMQADNANAGGGDARLVPFRQCKLTELLFSNSLANTHVAHKAPQKSIMIVTADPLGDFNSTSQILRYSALAKEIAIPRVPSLTSTILSGTTAAGGPGTRSGRTTPSALQEELEHALLSLASLREELEVTQFRLQEETRRREEAEQSWKVAESRIGEVEAEIREEVFEEMEARMTLEQRRWRAARDAELDAQDEHLDRKLELLTHNFTIYEDEQGAFDKENRDSNASPLERKSGVVSKVDDGRVEELEDENAGLRERLALMEREKEQVRSPSKKMRVLKTRKWDGSGMGLDGDGL